MRFSLALCATALALVTASIAACDGSLPIDDTPDRVRRVPQLPTCATDADCESTERCFDGHCHAACATSDDCGGTRALCDTAAGACVRCLVDGDCGAAQVCGAGGECVDGGANVCTPNEVGCTDAHAAFLCAADGQSKQDVPCRSDQICEDGVCHALVCTPDTAVCAGNARVLCDATGTSTTVTDCNSACDAVLGCACAEGACAPRSCEPSSARCVGNSAQQCDPLGIAFSALVDCGQDSCIGGRCLADTCTPGATLCSGRTLLTCNPNGVGFAESTCAEACAGVDGQAACVAQVCAPLAQTCIDDTHVRVCNANGTATADQSCGGGHFCADGVCQNQVCTPHASTCVGNSVATCNASGSAQAVTACAATQICENGGCVDTACVPQCGTRTCGPDPVCGTSCGQCPGTCTVDGQCLPPNGPTLTVELAWTPASEDLDLYLSRDPAAADAAAGMCTNDTCFFSTCKSGDARPDWDGTGTVSGGDPLLQITDPSHDNPEIASIVVPDGAARSFRVGADNFGTTTSGGTAATAQATIRVKLAGVTVATLNRSVPANTQWKGVTIQWDGVHATATDDAHVESPYDCTTPGGGLTCFSDSDCTNGTACSLDQFLGLAGTCVSVECTQNSNCTGGKLCSGAHTCVAGPLKGWKATCASAAECQSGFQCDTLTGRCEEPCSPSTCTAPNTPGCCTLTGGNTCTADGFLNLTGNCDP